MVWRFLKHYGVSKANDVLEEFASTVVAFDPQSASNAQIAMMEAELHKLGRRLAEAEAEVRREHRETADLRQNYDDYLEAARVLEAKLKDTEDPHERAEIESSLGRTIAKLEKLKPEIEREEEEDREVEAWRAELRRSFEELGEKLRHSRSELSSAKRRMDMARIRTERAQEQDRRALEAAGVTSSISSLSVALDAMNQQRAKLRAESETLKLKAGLFQAEQMETDPHIAAALDAARGNRTPEKQSLSDRLAALENSGDRPRLTIAS
jgi:chromosome segregation ATPase